MPFKVVQVAGGYKVQDDRGKFYSDKPMSKAACARQARALYANVPEAKKKEIGVLDWLLNSIEQKQAEPAALAVFKDQSGEARWVLFSSNSYRDGDDEIVSTEAINYDVEQSVLAAKENGADYGPLRWWHVEEADLGRCDFRTTSGSGRTLIESGTFRSKAIGEAIRKAAPQLQVSIGFHHPPDEPDGQGVYHTIRVFERSILPQGRAANPFTTVKVTGDEPMMTKEEKLKALKALLGEKAEEILAQADESEKELDEQGIAFKESASEPAAEPVVEQKAGAEEAAAEEAEEAEEEPELDSEAAAGEIEEEVIGNMPIGMYQSMLTDAFRAALVSAAAPAAEKKEAEPAPAASEPPAAPAAPAADPQIAALAETMKTLQAQLQKMSRELKELKGETPRAVKGFRASEAEETVLDAETQKELGAPEGDTYAAQFISNLLGIGQ